MSTHSNHADLDLELLLSQRDWLRGLARRLVGDEGDDLAQESLLRALRRRPTFEGDAGRARGWLARVARNLASTRARDDARRRAREQTAARPDAVSVEHAAEEGRRLVERVLALPEPARSSLLLHAFEGKSHREVARLTGVTAQTARKRVSRAYAELRRGLEEEQGRDWRAGLFALAGAPRSAAVVAQPAAAALGVLGVLAAAAVMTAAFLWVRAERRVAPGDPSILAHASTRSDVAEESASPSPAAIARTPRVPPQESVAGLTVHVASETADHPLTGASVSLTVDGPQRFSTPRGTSRGRVGDLLTTDASGRVTFEGLPKGRLHLWVDGAPVRHSGSAEVLRAEGTPLERTVVLRPMESVPLRLRVVDCETGAAVAGARVFVGGEGVEVTLADFPFPGEPWVEHGELVATSDAEGEAPLRWSSWLGPVEARVHAAGYGPAAVTLAEGLESGTLVTVLVARAGGLRGVDREPGRTVTVTCPRRAIQAGGSGVLGMDLAWTARADADGAWSLSGLPANVELAVDPGGGEVARVTLAPGETRTLDPAAPRACAVRGRVVREDGAPLAGARIVLARAADGAEGGYLAGGQNTATADAAGEFALEGVAQGRWRIAALDEEGKLAAWARALDLTEDRSLTLVARGGGEVVGRVRRPDGTPQVGARVSVRVVGTHGTVDATSGAEGEFRLGPLADEPHVLTCLAWDDPEHPFLLPDVPLVRPGETLDLRLARTTRVEYTVRDEVGDPVVAEVQAMCGPGGLRIGAPAGARGTLMLTPGTWSLCARTQDGRVGVLDGVQVAEGPLERVVVVGGPSGTLRVRNRAARRAEHVALVEGVPVGWSSVAPGEETEVALPPGALRLVPWDGEEIAARVVAGETVLVVVGE